MVFVYVGRLKRDKGIPELLAAFEEIAKTNSSMWLLLVGPDEENLGSLIQASPAITKTIMVGHTSSPELYLAASDVIVLPSHREGFGSSVIEAGACGIPAVASRIYGLTDAVVDGRTGLLVTRGDVGELARAMERLGKDRKLRLRMGRVAQRRAKVLFDQKKITEALLQFYRKILPLH
jgi:glycosyltransferase involved in cell wall biosynthesis